jgi:hypothetical protein
MRLYSRTNGAVGLVDNLYSTVQQNAEAAYQREMEPYADGNRLFRLCSVCEIWGYFLLMNIFCLV